MCWVRRGSPAGCGVCWVMRGLQTCAGLGWAHGDAWPLQGDHRILKSFGVDLKAHPVPPPCHGFSKPCPTLNISRNGATCLDICASEMGLKISVQPSLPQAENPQLTAHLKLESQIPGELPHPAPLLLRHRVGVSPSHRGALPHPCSQFQAGAGCCPSRRGWGAGRTLPMAGCWFLLICRAEGEAAGPGDRVLLSAVQYLLEA